MARYKLSWEMVRVTKLGKYSNADPMYYSNTTQTVPNSQIPDEDWHLVSKEFDEHELEERRNQYETLKSWSDADKDFVRNVKLWRMPGEPEWEQIDG